MKWDNLVLTIHQDYTKQTLIAELAQDMVILGKMTTRVNYGFEMLTFNVPLARAARRLWLDWQNPWWLAHVELYWGAKKVWQGFIGSITPSSNGVTCVALGYARLLKKTSISGIFNDDVVTAWSYGQTAQGFILQVLDSRVVKALQLGDVPGPGTAFDPDEYDDPLVLYDYIVTALDRGVEDRNQVHHWYFYIWEDRKLYTAEFQPQPLMWRLSDREGVELEIQISIDGWATTSYVDYATDTNRKLSQEYTDGTAERRSGSLGQWVNYRREEKIVNGDVADLLAKKELQTRQSPERLGKAKVVGPIEDINGLPQPGFLVRAGEGLRVLDWVSATSTQRDQTIYSTEYDFDSDTLVPDLNTAPVKWAVSKGGVLYAT